jgi:hypothetical protein
MLVVRGATRVVAIAGLAAGCVSHAVGTPSSNDVVSAAGGATVVTAQELARSTPQGMLLDALQRVRPLMLRSRGASPPLVSVDGSAPAELSLLRTIQTSTVREVRLLRASSSVGIVGIAPNGDVIASDVIVVTTWKGGR